MIGLWLYERKDNGMNKKKSQSNINPGIADIHPGPVVSMPLTGIGGLKAYITAQEKAGRELFDMVMHEKGTDEELRNLVTHRALLELILLTIALKTASTGSE